jgi:hypothetical protein
LKERIRRVSESNDHELQRQRSKNLQHHEQSSAFWK